MTFPRQIESLAFPGIEEYSIADESAATNSGGSTWALFQADMDAQSIFLRMFAKTYSVPMSKRAAGCNSGTYSKWRARSIHFVYRFNQIIDDWNDSILQSAAHRARGQLQVDESTESGFVEDAQGTPVYFNADTRLTLSFLKAAFPGTFDERTVIDLSPAFVPIGDEASIEQATESYLTLIKGGK